MDSSKSDKKSDNNQINKQFSDSNSGFQKTNLLTEVNDNKINLPNQVQQSGTFDHDLINSITPEENIKNKDIIIKNNKVKSNPFAKKNKKVISFEDAKQDQKDQDNIQETETTLTQPQSKLSNISTFLDTISNNGNGNDKDDRKDSKFNENLDKLSGSTGIGSSQL